MRVQLAGVGVDRLAIASPRPPGRYVRAWKRNAELMATLEQVATFNDDIRCMRLELRDRFVNRNTKAVARWQGPA